MLALHKQLFVSFSQAKLHFKITTESKPFLTTVTLSYRQPYTLSYLLIQCNLWLTFRTEDELLVLTTCLLWVNSQILGGQLTEDGG